MTTVETRPTANKPDGAVVHDSATWTGDHPRRSARTEAVERPREQRDPKWLAKRVFGSVMGYLGIATIQHVVPQPFVFPAVVLAFSPAFVHVYRQIRLERRRKAAGVQR